MNLSEYLDEHHFYHTPYLTLMESESTLIPEDLYGGLYDYFINVGGESYHILVQNLSMTIMMKPEFIILVNGTGLNNKISYCDLKFKVRLNHNKLTVILVIFDNPRNPLEVPFIYNLDDPGISFEISKLLEQETIDIFFVEEIDNMLYQRSFRKLTFDNNIKNLIKNAIQQYLDISYSDDSEFIDSSDVISLLESADIDYLSIAIQRDDIEENNIEKYMNMLDRLYPHNILTNKLCERVAIHIEGYDSDPRDLWEFSEVKAFVRALNDRFCYWFYFLDKSTNSLLWITLSLCGTGNDRNGGYEIDNAAFNNFLHKQIVYVNEVCSYANGTTEKAETIIDNVYKYYGIQ